MPDEEAPVPAPDPGTPCPECGRLVGGDSGVSPSKHMIYCLHVDPMSDRDLRGKYGPQAAAGNEHARRVLYLLSLEGS